MDALPAEGVAASAVTLVKTQPWPLAATWRLNHRECLRTVQSHTEGVSSVALTVDGFWVPSGNADMTSAHFREQRLYFIISLLIISRRMSGQMGCRIGSCSRYGSHPLARRA